MSRSDGATGPFGASGGELPVEQALVLDEACNAFEKKWRGGGRPDILAAVLELPEAVRGAALRELIQLDVFYRRKCGEVPAAGAYVERFPELDPEWLAGVVTVGASVSGRQTASIGESSIAAAPAAGSRVGDFELLEELDHGGMGVVYKARQVGLNREVALKMLLAGAYASPALRARFLVEAESVAALEHPHIVRVFAFGENGRHPYLAMEYLPGGTLAQRLKKGGPMPAREAAGLVAQLAEAVAHAHSRGVVHRDIKPANVLFGADGEPRLADFGLAKVGRTDRNLSVTGQVLGTPAYMAPEQAAGKVHEVGTASDVYALGAVLYDVLTGRPPFLGDSHAVTLQKVIAEEPARPRSVNPSVPRDLETICLKCLEKDPARRYATAQALAVELGRFLRGEPVEARRAGPVERAYKWVRRNKAATAVGALTALVLLSAVGGGVALAYSRTLEGKNRDLESAKTEAEGQRATAEHQRTAADVQRGEAVKQRSLGRRYLYATRLALAGRAFHDGYPQRAVELLDLCRDGESGQEDLRNFEWEYLWRQCHGDMFVNRAHRGVVAGVTFSPDGRTIASAGADRVVKLTDSRSGQELGQLAGFECRVSCVAFSPDGRYLAAAGGENKLGHLRVWDLSTSKVEISREFAGEELRAVAFSPASTSIATAGANGGLWEGTFPAGVQLMATKGHAKAATALVYSPDGKLIASAGEDKVVKLWERRSQKVAAELAGCSVESICRLVPSKLA